MRYFPAVAVLACCERAHRCFEPSCRKANHVQTPLDGVRAVQGK